MLRGAVVLVGFLLVLAVPAQAKTANAGIGDFFFRADRVRIEPGDTVTWTNRGDATHTVTSRRGAPQGFDSGNVDAGQGFSRVFSKPGTYRYLCALHPDLMSGVVQVGPDTVKPVVSRSVVSSSKRVRVRFSLSERATVKANITRRGKTVRTLRGQRLAAGSRELSAKALPKGVYRLKIQATDLEGNRSKVLRSTFPVS